MLMGDSSACEITVGCDKYWVMRLAAAGKAGFTIVDLDGSLVAEVSFGALNLIFIFNFVFSLSGCSSIYLFTPFLQLLSF